MRTNRQVRLEGTLTVHVLRAEPLAPHVAGAVQGVLGADLCITLMEWRYWRPLQTSVVSSAVCSGDREAFSMWIS